MKMRWVLTWKDDGSLKARLVVQGFTDPHLGYLPTSSPTCSRRARHVFLTLAASLGFEVCRGDVRTAFLQGDGEEGQRNVLCEPVEELRRALGLEHHEVVRLLKGVYGLVNAPRLWWTRVRKDLKELGWEEITTEPCFWVKRNAKGKIVGLSLIHI